MQKLFVIPALAVSIQACSTGAISPPPTPQVSSVSLTCAPKAGDLNCRALASRAGEQVQSEPADVTGWAVWSSSDDRLASVERGRVTGVTAGVVSIAASIPGSSPAISASVKVVVDRPGGVPQVAYEVEGAVRDSSNRGVADVDVTLAREDDEAQTVAAAKSVDGLFRLPAVAGGRYQLRAVRAGYRVAEKSITIPDPLPLTLVMLPEPTARVPVSAGR